MEILPINAQNGGFNARGKCPHCGVVSLYISAAGPKITVEPDRQDNWSNILAECQSCHRLTYIIATRANHGSPWRFDEIFPTENPEESVDKTIPPGVREDFIEALRCKSVKGYKATVVMCRRALQASCAQFRAEGDRLINQIDDLASKGKITSPLKDMAHDIRKLGNDGAHPGEDGLGDVTAPDAEDIVEFTRQYFEHVYVMPARSDAFRKRREAVVAASPK